MHMGSVHSFILSNAEQKYFRYKNIKTDIFRIHLHRKKLYSTSTIKYIGIDMIVNRYKVLLLLYIFLSLRWVLTLDRRSDR